MSPFSHPPAQSAPEYSWLDLLHIREMWASLARGDADPRGLRCRLGAGLFSTTGGGTKTTTISSGIAVALFATIGTWAVAQYGLVLRGRQRSQLASRGKEVA